MSLTAGATLQNGKYLIQSVLHQTDASVSYQATHTSLNHPVVIHTLNPCLQQSPRLPMLRQQFFATVKQDNSRAAIVRDCFEENEMPFVVLEPTPTPIDLAEWMPFLTAAVLTSTMPNGDAVTAANGIAPPQTLPVVQSTPPQLPALPAESIALPAESIAPPPKIAQPASALRPRSRRNRWIPVALLLTAATAGLTGAAIGWRIRQGAATPSAPALFSREQSFPEKTDWLGEDPYAEDSSGSDSESASPAIERRSLTPRRRAIEPERAYEPEPEYEAPRSRSRWVDRSTRPAQRDSQSELEPQPQEEAKPAIEAPKVEALPDLAPPVEAPPPDPALAAPEPPAPIEPSPKTQVAPAAEPIAQ